MDRFRPGSLLVGACAVVVGACGGGTAATEGTEASTTLTVFAASSLADAFTEIAVGFETGNPGIDVVLNVAGSSSLAAQIRDGAPVDVFASADAETMDRIVADGHVEEDPVVFATNTMAMVVEKGNPLGISGLADLARPDLVVVACAPEVPCGRYADTVLAEAGVMVRPRSLEDSVRAVVTKVSLGEADAGIVYATDVVATGGAVEGIDLPSDVNVRAEYPLAVLRDARNPIAARAFLAFVTSASGRAILDAHGFGAP